MELSALQIVLLILVAAEINLDRRGLSLTHARPVIVGFLCGLILGDMNSGLYIGGTFTLMISSTRSFGNNTSLCHGDFSSLEIMKLAGKVLYDKKVLEREKLSFHWLYENVMQERYGGKCFRGTEVLGLMLGLSGYVYSLVQHSSNEIPSILYLQ